MPVSEFCIFRGFERGSVSSRRPGKFFLQVLMAGGLKSLFFASADSADVMMRLFVSAESEGVEFLIAWKGRELPLHSK
jgi:hypothetical protein